MSELRERVYNFMKVQGPVVPTQVAKYIENESYVASAVLSELLNSKKIQMTHKSVGSSRLYFIKGQEDKIGDLVYSHLKSKEKEAYDLLKEHSVLKDTELEPWCRVALRNLPDFAMGILVETSSGQEGFWKFYLVEDSTAKDLITENWVGESEVETVEEVEEEPEIVEGPEYELVEEEFEEEAVVEPVKKKDLSAYVEVPKPKLEGNFYKKVVRYFENNGVEIIDQTLIKKNKEFAFIVSVPSNIGDFTLFAYAKDKKSITENDLALAFVESQRKNMACMLLSTGGVSKKTEELLNGKYAGSVIFKKLK